jgi:hypothetical protein
MSTFPWPSDNPEIDVRLPPELTQAHREAIQRYLRGDERMTGDDWSSLIQAMDLLRQAQVISNEGSKSFAAIYDEVVDAVYSDRLLESLMPLADPEHECEVIRAAMARQILADLRSRGVWRVDVPATQFLVAFCLYWWQMFVRGYAFEIAIQRDLADSRIAHVAHDLRQRQDRLAGHDLEVMGFRGDIKTSTYFVLARRGETLAHDFYITRMYHAAARQWHRVVWLKLAFWKLLDGEPTPTAYDAIWQTLPGAAMITLRSREFVVVLYAEWKRRLIARQAKEINSG